MQFPGREPRKGLVTSPIPRAEPSLWAGGALLVAPSIYDVAVPRAACQGRWRNSRQPRVLPMMPSGDRLSRPSAGRRPSAARRRCRRSVISLAARPTLQGSVGNEISPCMGPAPPRGSRPKTPLGELSALLLDTETTAPIRLREKIALNLGWGAVRLRPGSAICAMTWLDLPGQSGDGRKSRRGSNGRSMALRSLNGPAGAGLP